VARRRTYMPSTQADGFVIAKTKTAILVAEYAAPAQAPEAVVVVEGVADWLRTAGS
jgi:profilin